MATDKAKPHWRTVIKRMDPAYLYAEDLGGPGTKVDVEIIDAGKGTLKNPGGAKETIVLTFRGAKKKLGLNATMCKTLTGICGSDHWGDWRGWITLVVLHKRMRDPTTEEIEDLDVIRIAPARPRGKEPGKPDAAPATMSADELAEIARIEREERSR